MLLQKELTELEQFIEHAQKNNPSVSSRGVDWHLDHTLMSIIGIIKRLEASSPEDYKANFSLARFFVFTRGSIPRGRGKAPKVVNPEQVRSADELYKQLELAKLAAQRLKELPKNSHFKHPYFGVLNRQNTLRFLQIHTQHHIKIMSDIINE